MNIEQIGRDGENWFISLLRERKIPFLIKNKNASRDIQATIGDTAYLFEIKNEDNNAKTGNLAIEFCQYRQYKNPLSGYKASGIYLSSATHCVHKLQKMACLYETAHMRAYIMENNKQHGGRLIQIGPSTANVLNGNMSRLVNIHQLKQYPWFWYGNHNEVLHNQVIFNWQQN